MSVDIAKRINELCKTKNIKQKDLVDFLNENQGTVAKWLSESENTNRNIPYTILIKFSEILNTTTDFILGKETTSYYTTSSVKENYSKPKTNSQIMIKVHKNVNLSAGDGIVAVDDTGTYEMAFDKYILRRFFGVVTNDIEIAKVNGDSMEPRIKDGEFVFIDRGLAPKDGDIVAFRLFDELYIKTFYGDPFKRWMKFVSFNEDYDDMKVDTQEQMEAVMILGVVKTGLISF